MTPSMMKAALLKGQQDIRIDQVPYPGEPGRGMVIIKVTAVGLCGTDLSTFRRGENADNFIPGHEFTGIVEKAGPDCLDGQFNSIKPGARVAIDPAQSCGLCEMCEKGNPNLCENLHFLGLYPDNGSLCQRIMVKSHSCFPLPDTLDNSQAVMLEPLGVGIHTTDLAHIKVTDSVAIIGAGPIGLCILQLVKLSGGNPVFITDKLPWRLDMARQFGGVAINSEQENTVDAVMKMSQGRGVDVAIEAAWADGTVQEATEMTRLGGRVVLVGIPAEDQLIARASTLRRKGLTIRMCRRMKHAYPRAIKLVEQKMVDVSSMVSHHFPFEKIAEAYALNTEYRDNVIKVIIDIA